MRKINLSDVTSFSIHEDWKSPVSTGSARYWFARVRGHCIRICRADKPLSTAQYVLGTLGIVTDNKGNLYQTFKHGNKNVIVQFGSRVIAKNSNRELAYKGEVAKNIAKMRKEYPNVQCRAIRAMAHAAAQGNPQLV